jgi:hypothetical protein
VAASARAGAAVLKWPKSSEARQAVAAVELIAEGADVLQECYALLTQSEALKITQEVNDLWERLIDWRLKATTRQFCPKPDTRHKILRQLNELLDHGLAASAVCRRYMDDGRGFGNEWSDDGERVKDLMRRLWHLNPSHEGYVSNMLQLGYRLAVNDMHPDHDSPTTDETR